MTASVCITTHNRRADLRRTLTEMEKLAPAPDEIVICCDGCTDGTPEMIGREFPRVRTLVNEESQGSVGSRVRLLEESRGDLILSFDDDSHPLESDFVSRVSNLFERMPRLGIASFPQRTDEFPETLEAPDFGPSKFVGSYAASAAAFRRSIYLKVPGWDRTFQHGYEEPDLSLQMIAAGYQVFHHTGVTVRHHYSPTNRNEIRIHHLHARNEQWSIWKRCPFPQLPAISFYRLFRQFSYATTRGVRWVIEEPTWWMKALRGAGHCRETREPVPWKIYYGWMKLLGHPLADEAEWNRRFLQ